MIRFVNKLGLYLSDEISEHDNFVAMVLFLLLIPILILTKLLNDLLRLTYAPLRGKYTMWKLQRSVKRVKNNFR